MLVVLDSGPLGLLSNPSTRGPAAAAAEWATSLIRAGHVLVVPELADYEVRRELLRADRVVGLERLDALVDGLRYEPISTTAMRHAAEFWAQARRRGRPTAPDHALDGDVVLAGQAAALAPAEVVVATTNARHLARYVDARRWTDVR
jgi:hypothetical protein